MYQRPVPQNLSPHTLIDPLKRAQAATRVHLKREMRRPSPDVSFTDHGSLVMVHAYTAAAQAWVDEHIPDDAPRMGLLSFGVEPRYLADILHGMRADGLTVTA